MVKSKKTTEVSDLQNKLARALADYENLVKRQTRERQEVILRANRGILEELLGVIDNLEKAETHLGDPGLKMAMDNLRGILVKYGVSEIDTSTGSEFDINLHEAIDAIEGEVPGTIAQILTKGYQWSDGQILRPAKVIVYKEN